ncbi:MAG: IS66 family transposase [Candidatus Riflebacteria bacterium]|nr:IS66 family transposase [Candidatus Riflebacteria bacterium]
MIAKFLDAIPLHRQEKQFLRTNINISRATMCKWILRVAAACETIVELMHDEITMGKYVAMDETPLQVLNEENRSNTTKSYIWVCYGGLPDKPCIIYRYYKTRESKIPKDILKNFSGYLQTDGYSGYKLVGNRSGIVHLACLAHVRRKFVDVVKISKKAGIAQQALDFIGQLYAVEREADEKNLSADQRKSLRESLSKPIFEELKLLLDRNKTQTPARSLLGKAINYALNLWKELNVYIQDGNLRIDNNLVENKIRPIAMGRKNWLFAGCPNGADALAILYSIIETARANGLEPYGYLRYLFTNLPAASTPEEKKALLPQYVVREKLLSV